jgi:prepilin-type N-terminal cleavage/methylation domain-containing protein
MKSKKRQGFTLIELIVVILLVAIISIGVASLLNQGFQAYSSGKNLINADWETRVALERMSREIRSIPSTNSIITAQPGVFNFIDNYGNNIAYQLSSTQLMRNSQVLADSVQNLAFTYYANNGTAVTDVNLTNYIGVSVTINYQGTSSTFSTTIFPWWQR